MILNDVPDLPDSPHETLFERFEYKLLEHMEEILKEQVEAGYYENTNEAEKSWSSIVTRLYDEAGDKKEYYALMGW